MGRGDGRTRKGKIFRKSSGKTRLSAANKNRKIKAKLMENKKN